MTPHIVAVVWFVIAFVIWVVGAARIDYTRTEMEIRNDREMIVITGAGWPVAAVFCCFFLLAAACVSPVALAVWLGRKLARKK